MKASENTSQSHHEHPATRFTPRQLIMHHMDYPDEPIREKDIENLVLDLAGVNGWLDENKMYKNDSKFSFS